MIVLKYFYFNIKRRFLNWTNLGLYLVLFFLFLFVAISAQIWWNKVPFWQPNLLNSLNQIKAYSNNFFYVILPFLILFPIFIVSVFLVHDVYNEKRENYIVFILTSVSKKQIIFSKILINLFWIGFFYLFMFLFAEFMAFFMGISGLHGGFLIDFFCGVKFSSFRQFFSVLRMESGGMNIFPVQIDYFIVILIIFVILIAIFYLFLAILVGSLATNLRNGIMINIFLYLVPLCFIFLEKFTNFGVNKYLSFIPFFFTFSFPSLLITNGINNGVISAFVYVPLITTIIYLFIFMIFSFPIYFAKILDQSVIKYLYSFFNLKKRIKNYLLETKMNKYYA